MTIKKTAIANAKRLIEDSATAQQALREHLTKNNIQEWIENTDTYKKNPDWKKFQNAIELLQKLSEDIENAAKNINAD